MHDCQRTDYAPARAACTAPPPADADDLGARLNWLVAFDAEEARRRGLFRDAREEREMLLMRRPVPARKAYALFGLLLGLLPPAAIFHLMVGYPLMNTRGVGASERLTLFLFCLVMNGVCCLVGRGMGVSLARRAGELERGPWAKMLALSALLGVLWAVVTGAAGGAVVFLFGAIFGALFALPVGALGFLLFTSLHRLVARGGMIDARHLWPLACGVALFIAAMILGMKQ